MTKCPCPKHKDQFINYIQFSEEQTQLSCNLCLINNYIGLFNAPLDIMKALKSPEELLIYFSPNSSQEEFLKVLFQFDETHFKTLLTDYEKRVNALKDQILAVLADLKTQSDRLLKKFQYFKEYITQFVQHDDFKKIVTEFQSNNSQINQTAFSKSEETIHQYLNKLNERQENFYHLEWNLSLQKKKDNFNQQLFQNELIKLKQKQVEIVQYSLHLNLLGGYGQLLYTSFLPTIEQTITNKLNKKIKTYQQIYSRVVDGLNMNTLWDKIDGKDHLLMFFKSGSLNVFGAYSPCKWGKTINAQVQDTTAASFIFSQTNNQIFPLKADQKQNAIYSYQPSYGPYFGGNNDLYITTTFTVGSGSPGSQYQITTGQTIQLHGTSTTIVECEIYQIIFE